MKSDKYYIFGINTKKSPKQFNQIVITMRVIIKDNNLLAEPKAISFDLPKQP